MFTSAVKGQVTKSKAGQRPDVTGSLTGQSSRDTSSARQGEASLGTAARRRPDALAQAGPSPSIGHGHLISVDT